MDKSRTHADAPSPHRATLRDVAQTANVSVATASKALNGNGRISAETRRLVQAAAKQLGYQRPSGTSEQRKRPSLVGMITSDYNGRFSLPIMTGAESTLGAANHAALLMTSHGKPMLERSHIDMLASYGVDGLIVVGDISNPRPPLSKAVTMGLPVVYTYDPSTSPDDCSVICDNMGAGRQAIEYLIGHGRRSIAIVGGPNSFQASRDRTAGALEIFRLYGMEPVAHIADRWSEEWGERAATVLMHTHPETDAVYCLSDEIARGMARGLQSKGKRIPQDVAIIGHDNWDVFCSSTHPTLTTFDNNIALIGKTAAQLLIDAINGHPHHGIVTVECPMIIRESTEVSRHMPLRGSGYLTGLETD